MVHNDDMFIQKVRYIHENPVVAGYVSVAEAYDWSSARPFMTTTDSYRQGHAEAVVEQFARWAT